MADILMHICCAPDATVGYERLSALGSVLGIFYNPNIEPVSEYYIRETEVKRLSAEFGFDLVDEAPDRVGWRRTVKGWEAEPERGERCRRCIAFNLRQVALVATRLGIPAFATTLTASPHKDVDYILKTGKLLAEERGIVFIPEVLRKQGGFYRALDWSRRLGLYRQHYCGCRWSLAAYYRSRGIECDLLD